MDNTYVMCLKSSANFYESFSEMESKLASSLQKDFELLQSNWEKHSKRVTKDERAHDEILGDLDERIKKISLSYDKKSKKPDPNTMLMSHEKYISTLSELQDSIATAKRDHRNTMARRERYTHSMTAQIACRLSEAQFLAVERQLRGCGPSLLKIKEWAPYAGHDMPAPTLITNGEPTIEIKGGTWEEYSARHAPNPGQQQNVPGAYQGPKAELGGGVGGATQSGGSSAPVYTLTEMPQITLPPFAPMQQHLQQQQQQQQQQPLPTPVPLPVPPPRLTSPPGSSTPSTYLPNNMPDPKAYIQQSQRQQQQQISPGSLTKTGGITSTPLPLPTPRPNITTMPTTMRLERPSSMTATMMQGSGPIVGYKSLPDPKAQVRSTTIPAMGQDRRTSGGVGPGMAAGGVGGLRKSASSDSIQFLTVSPVSTPGAFPEMKTQGGGRENSAADHLKRQDGTNESTTATTAGAGTGTGNGEGSFPEDQRSMSIKTGTTNSSIDGGSTRTVPKLSKDYYEQEQRHSHLQRRVEHDDEDDEDADGEDEERYRNGKYDLERYGYPDDDDTGAHSREERDQFDDHMYSPSSGDQLSFYDDGDEGHPGRMLISSRRFYDDDESQHSSGSIPTILREREREREYYLARTSAPRYDDEREYEQRSYTQQQQQQQRSYSSTAPTRQYLQHLTHPDSDQDREREWSASAAAMAAAQDESASMSGYAREQYPAQRDYTPARPTLEDRERELELMQGQGQHLQKPTSMGPLSGGNSGADGAGAEQGQGPVRPAYGRRPATAPGTVAHLRRRFSDQNIAESLPPPPLSPTQSSRPRGLSGSAANAQQQQQQQDALNRDRDRDTRYPPRVSTPQSRLVAAHAYRSERVISSTGMNGKAGAGAGMSQNGQYNGTAGHMSDYEDTSPGRTSAQVGDQRARRR
ncbi:hypothetical protein BC939DRAFT_462633 [Gamsiella multidivaricata]|uniref:uncharacterized protein n=1 Tax=Gamsiella multidivaricata TaxID=101098 RepID=UPI0022210F0B|nr:uncharacterized protein BC939DRAFT_462633 [Gamsiella multidivaricata]KAI7818597.1 hypothetical protein BC939DRAFT_462633 [Gamsiella multidivaricata]